MSIPRVYTDNNLLIALTLGSEIDTKAQLVQKLYIAFKEKGKEIWIQPTVLDEFNEKIKKIYDWIMKSLEQLYKTIDNDPAVGDLESYIDTLESMFTYLRENNPHSGQWILLEQLEYSFILDAESTRRGDEAKYTLKAIVRAATFEMQSLYSVLEKQVMSYNDVFRKEKDRTIPQTQMIQRFKEMGITGKDKVHLAYCAYRSNVGDGEKVLFMTYDNPILKRKNEIISDYPNFEVSHPGYTIHKLRLFPFPEKPKAGKKFLEKVRRRGERKEKRRERKHK